MIIITDTPSLFAPNEGISKGLVVIPACSILSEKAYRDFEDIDTVTFLDRISNGEIATTSQPAIGDIMEAYEKYRDDILVLPIGDGLSGTYQNMESAKNLVEDGSRIHIVNTKTLAGPQHYIVKKAMELRDCGLTVEEIKEKLQDSIDSTVSFVIPFDFNFLKRSGRLTPFAAKLGTIMKLVPVMTQTEDKKRITRFCVKTSKKSALEAIIQRFKELNVGKGYLITVCNGGVEKEAESTAEILRQSFEEAEIETAILPPSLVCHGGPGCILIQAVKL